MAVMTASIEEQFADLRSDHTAYKLTLSNLSNEPVRILSITPRIPLGAQLVDIIDSNIEEASSRRANLLAELDAILFDYLATTSEPYREKVATSMKSVAETIFTALGILKLYFHLFQGKNILCDRDTEGFRFFEI